MCLGVNKCIKWGHIQLLDFEIKQHNGRMELSLQGRAAPVKKMFLKCLLFSTKENSFWHALVSGFGTKPSDGLCSAVNTACNKQLGWKWPGKLLFKGKEKNMPVH